MPKRTRYRGKRTIDDLNDPDQNPGAGRALSDMTPEEVAALERELGAPIVRRPGDQSKAAKRKRNNRRMWASRKRSKPAGDGVCRWPWCRTPVKDGVCERGHQQGNDDGD